MAFEAGKRSPSASSHFTEVTYFNYVKRVNRIICLTFFLVKALLVAYKIKACSALTRNLKSISPAIHSFPACLPHFPSCLLPTWTSWKARDRQVTPLEKPRKSRSFCLHSGHCWTWEHPFRKAVFKSTLYSRHAALSLPLLRCTRLLQRDYSHTAGTNHLSASTNNEMNEPVGNLDAIH